MTKEEYIKRFERIKYNIDTLIQCIKYPKTYKLADEDTMSDIVSCYSDCGDDFSDLYEKFVKEFENESI